MDKYEYLKWKTVSKQELLHTRVFDVLSLRQESSAGIKGDYISLKARDWVMTVAVHNGNFVLVRQWRHGEGRLTLEFPGGVTEPDENPVDASYRELLEETGFKAHKLTLLGKVSSNPAIFENHIFIVLAEELEQTGAQHPDEDELLEFEEMPIADVIAKFGDEEMTHAYMGTALAFYLRHIGK